MEPIKKQNKTNKTKRKISTTIALLNQWMVVCQDLNLIRLEILRNIPILLFLV